MTEPVFSDGHTANYFDNLTVDVARLYEEHPIDAGSGASGPTPPSVPAATLFLHRTYRSTVIPLRYRERLWLTTRQIGLDQSWFQDFSSYWASVLKGRPLLGVHDLFFLKNLYRIRFQDSFVPDTDDSYVHLQAWQQPELLYQLLHLACRESVENRLSVLRPLFALKKKVESVLEFGCGTAPITVSLFDFFRSACRIRVHLCDIQTLAFHYAAYRFRHRPNVKPTLLVPENEFLLTLDEPVDAVFCMTVLEHLNRPLETVKALDRILKPGGLLLFDFILSKGGGLDTRKAVEQRRQVLAYITTHFEVVQGTISNDRSMGLTIVRKPKAEASVQCALPGARA